MSLVGLFSRPDIDSSADWRVVTKHHKISVVTYKLFLKEAFLIHLFFFCTARIEGVSSALRRDLLGPQKAQMFWQSLWRLGYSRDQVILETRTFGSLEYFGYQITLDTR